MNKDIKKSIRLVEFDKAHLSKYANSIGAGKGAVEKDFLISTIFMLLAYDGHFAEFSEKAVFRGGTCIKKAYYPDDARLSEDLDFMGLTLTEMKSLREILQGLVEEDLGVTSVTEVRTMDERPTWLNLGLYYRSVLGQVNHIMFDLDSGTPTIPPTKRSIDVKPYYQSYEPEILVMDMAEILAEKMRALLQRAKPRDVFDIWFLTTKKRVKVNHELLKEKLMRNYEAAPEDAKEATSFYSIDKTVDKIQELGDTPWRQELGGLLLKNSPPRQTIVSRVSQTLKKVGDIRLVSRN